jgi:hypothetical protein
MSAFGGRKPEERNHEKLIVDIPPAGGRLPAVMMRSFPNLDLRALRGRFRVA